MPLYEHIFMSRQDISQAQVEALQKEFTDIIIEGGGTISKVEYWGVKSLTYKIKKNRKAHFTLMNIDAPSAAVAEMERRMGISTDVLRTLTVRVDAHETEPSVMMRKGDREERGERGGFRGDRGPRGDRGGGGRFGDRERGGGDRGDRGDRPPREGGFRRDRDGEAPRRPRDPAAPPAPSAGTVGE